MIHPQKLAPAAAALIVSLAASSALAQDAPATNPAAVQRVEAGDGSMRDLATAKGGPAVGKRDDKLEAVALFDGPPLVTGVTGTSDGRLFVSFPRWTQPTNITAAEVVDGRLVPFPNGEMQQFLPSQPDKFDPREHLVSVQSVIVDAKGRLWVLDTGSINLQPPIEGGPKLLGYDISGDEPRQIVRVDFSKGTGLKEKTYLNDVRFLLDAGEAGYAFITDSNEGAIIVVDLASGDTWRKLDGHPSVAAVKDSGIKAEGQVLEIRPPGTQESKPLAVASDGIALSPDGSTLYYSSLTQRKIYAVPTDALTDESADAASQVKEVASKPSANDGIICDAQGRIYSTDFEDNAIRQIEPESGEVSVVVQDERLLWPDTLFVRDGHVYVTTSQLNRQPQFHRGQSMLERPFAVFRYPVEGAELIESR